MSYEEFLARCDEDTWAEWIDGEVVALMPASLRHQRLVDFLLGIMRFFVEEYGLGEIISAPFQMKLPRSGREPDLVFVTREHLARLLPARLDGPADLAIEVVSPESLHRDYGEKYREYEAGGVREYWLIDPDRQRAEFYRLGADGHYHQMPVDGAGIIRSEALSGFWLRIEWLWQDPPPAMRLVLQDLGLLHPAGE